MRIDQCKTKLKNVGFRVKKRGRGWSWAAPNKKYMIYKQSDKIYYFNSLNEAVKALGL